MYTRIGGSVRRMPSSFVPRRWCVRDTDFGRRAVAEFRSAVAVTSDEPDGVTGILQGTPRLLAAITHHRLVYEMRLALFKIDMTNETYARRARYSANPSSNRVSQLFSGRLPIKLDDIGLAYTILGDHLPALDPRGWASEMRYRYMPSRGGESPVDFSPSGDLLGLSNQFDG